MTRLRLLLVEDDEIDREAVLRAIDPRSGDLEVTAVGSLEAARVHLAAHPVDCVLSDLSLPDGEGLELLRHAGEAPLVVLTGGTEERAHEALRRGAQDYLSKDRLDGRWIRRSLQYAIERKRLLTLTRETEHQDRLASLGHLAASIAHEINNPIAFVSANIDTLLRWERAEAAEEQQPGTRRVETLQMLEDCHAGLERVASIVAQLQSFGRRSDDHEPEVASTLAEVAEWAAALTRTRIAHVGKLELETRDGAGPFWGRPGRMAQVVTNLLVNAVQAAEVGSRPARLWLRVLEEGSRSRLQVHDSGPGLPPELRERVFTPFFTTKPVGTGTGLGLAVSRGIVEAHGGSLTLAESPLGGVMAVVDLPRLAGTRRRRAPGTAGRSPATEIAPLTVLVIDDEPALRRALARMLRPHEVHAMDAAPALAWLEDPANAAKVDAVICDVMMPGADGREVYEHLSAAHPRLANRFVFCSGGAFQPELAHYLATSNVPLLLKPVSRDIVMKTLSELMLPAGEPGHGQS